MQESYLEIGSLINILRLRIIVAKLKFKFVALISLLLIIITIVHSNNIQYGLQAYSTVRSLFAWGLAPNYAARMLDHSTLFLFVCCKYIPNKFVLCVNNYQQTTCSKHFAFINKQSGNFQQLICDNCYNLYKICKDVIVIVIAVIYYMYLYIID